MEKFSQETLSKLGNYVYALIDPRDGEIFYIGKASGNNRAFDHFNDTRENKKVQRINEIKKTGLLPFVDIMRSGLDENAVLEVEAAIIDTLGVENLTNEIRGHGIRSGRLEAEKAELLYGAKPIDIKNYQDSLILFFVHQTYSPTMDNIARYDCIRQFWGVGERARNLDSEGKLPYQLAVGVVDSVAVAVYSIAAWFPAGTTMSTRSTLRGWEFVGKEIEDHQLTGQLLTRNGENIKAIQTGFTYIN